MDDLVWWKDCSGQAWMWLLLMLDLIYFLDISSSRSRFAKAHRRC